MRNHRATPSDIYLDVLCDALERWARWQRAVKAGRPAGRCAQLALAWEARRFAVHGLRNGANVRMRLFAPDAVTRVHGLTAVEGLVLAHLVALGRKRVRRTMRRLLGDDVLPKRARAVPVDLLASITELSTDELSRALLALSEVDECTLSPAPLDAEAPAGTAEAKRWREVRHWHDAPFRLRNPAPLRELGLPQADREALLACLDPASEEPAPLVVLVGPPGAGKDTLARAMAEFTGLQLLRLPMDGATPRERRSARPTAAEFACLHWIGDSIRGPGASGDIARCLRFLDARDPDAPCRLDIIALTGDAPLSPELTARADLVVNLTPQSNEAQREVWQALLTRVPLEEGFDPSELASGPTLAPGQIVRLIRRAHTLAVKARGRDARLSVDDLRDVVRAGPTAGGLKRSARGAAQSQPATKSVDYEALVLAPETRDRLDEFVAFATFAPEKCATLAPLDLVAAGSGVVALFEGPPGTGKTATAQALASRLERRLITAELGALMSMWHGETEKQIEAMFASARHDALLFIDEADSLLSARRGETHGSADRLVNVFLVELERHPGPVVLATNFATALDPALARRVHFRVPFGPPNEAMREALWRLYLPPTLAGAQAINVAALAREFALSGAEIRTVARRVVIRALSAGVEVNETAVRAVADELRRNSQTGKSRAVAGFHAA